MRKLLATAVLILASATSAFAGWGQHNIKDNITGVTSYGAISYGKADGRTWYNDDDPSISFVCIPGLEGIRLIIDAGTEVLDSDYHTDTVSYEMNLSGTYLGRFDGVLTKSMDSVVAVIHFKKNGAFHNPNGFGATLYNNDGGILTVRLPKHADTSIELQFDVRGAREIIKNAAWSCGIPLKK